LENLTLSPQLFLNQLQAFTRSKNLLIAYSGGLDSHVLLQLASQLASANNTQTNNYNVRAIHVHHGLQQQADAWVVHCQQVCDELNISLEVKLLDLKIIKGESLEEVARTARYTVLKESLIQDEILLTAHHQNDQAETLLLQLFRGAGVQGLAGMPVISHFGLGQHVRPLLNESRQSLEGYAKENHLNFIEDPSNKDCAFDRNFLRNGILPRLRERWPSIDKTISRSAGIQAETKHLLDDLAKQDLQLAQESLNQGDCLPIAKLHQLSKARQRLLVRYWIAVNGFNPPSEKKLKHVFSDVVNASGDAQPLVEWRGAEIRRHQGMLYIMLPLQYHDNTQVFDWVDPLSPLKIPTLNLIIPALLSSQYEANQSVTIRFRQGGEKIYRTENSMKISLKNFLNESGVPTWLRSRIPLIYSGDKLVKVVGVE